MELSAREKALLAKIRASEGRPEKAKRHPVMLPGEVYDEIDMLRAIIMEKGTADLPPEVAQHIQVHGVTQVGAVRAAVEVLNRLMTAHAGGGAALLRVVFKDE